MSYPIKARPNVAIITSITDGYDTLKKITPQFGLNVEWIAITDGTEQAESGHGWEIQHFIPHDMGAQSIEGLRSTPPDETHPNRLAKLAKCTPWRVTSAPYSIWLDASYRVTSGTFAFDALKCAHPIAQFVHPWRDCVYDEAAASAALTKYDDQWESIRSQSREYDAIGHPRNWGLWATGVIVRKHTPEVKEMGEQWLAEIRRHSYQDQVSEPVSLRLCDMRPSPLPGDHITNPWLKYEGSARHG